MKRIIVGLFSPLFGKKKMYGFFEKLYYFSLYGLNYAYGDRMESNGEKKAIGAMSRYLTQFQNPVLFDVGANVGDYTSAMAHIFGSNATIYSFEPSPKVFEQLQHNTKEFGNVICINAGLGIKTETVSLFYNETNTTTASIFSRDMSHWGDSFQYNKTDQINLISLDEFCESKGINKIHFLKLDVEGNEMNVFRGASHFLQSDKIDFIQFEFGVCQVDSRNFFKDYFYFLSPQFRIYKIMKDGLIELVKYNESLEVFRTANYLAVSKSVKDFNY